MSMTDSQRPSDYPGWLRALARGLYRLAGWRVEGTAPNFPKMLVIGAPHTSNWDGIHMLALSTSLGIRMYWLGKHTLFKPPFGPIMRAVNGIPVNRESTKNGVEQVVEIFKEREKFVLIIAPEGTRKKVDYWKTGFYYIAQGAIVQIVLAYVDAPHRRVGLGPAIMPSGDIEADFEIFRAFYADKEGHHRDKKGTVALSPQDKRRAARASKSEDS
jgi:1-acyl-sn-glycerol-3-phosphate acyltransferase